MQTYRHDHVVALPNGTATSQECQHEDEHTQDDDGHGSTKVALIEGLLWVQCRQHHSAHSDQGNATQLMKEMHVRTNNQMLRENAEGLQWEHMRVPL